MARRAGTSALPFLLLATVPRSVSAGALFANSDSIVELTPDRFDATVLRSHHAWFVDYYADWCPHCIHFAPLWESIARQFRGDHRVGFGAVDCAVHGQFCLENKVGAYPTMRSYNLPGSKQSFTQVGARLHEGTYDVNKVEGLIALLRERLLAVGPPPSAAAGGACAGGAGGAGCKGRAGGASAPSVAARASRDAPAGPEGAMLRLMDAEVALLYGLRQGTLVAASAAAAGRDAGGARGTTSALTPTTLLPGTLPTAVPMTVGTSASPALEAEPLVALEGEVLGELVLWLSFLARALPSARGRSYAGGLATVARGAEEGSGQLPRSVWLEALDAQVLDVVPPQAGESPSAHWRLCATYTCGLWMLFHGVLTSIAAAAPAPPPQSESEEAGQTAGAAGDLFGTEIAAAAALPPPTPVEALERIRGFVANFFGCRDCVRHFLEMYDSCGFGRCALAPGDGRGAVLWLWRVHNNVTQRVAIEQSRVTRPEPWPFVSDCPGCWSLTPRPTGAEGPSWVPDRVFEYIQRAYTPPLEEAARSGNRGGQAFSQSSYVMAAIVLSLFLAGAGCLCWSRRALVPGPRGFRDGAEEDDEDEEWKSMRSR